MPINNTSHSRAAKVSNRLSRHIWTVISLVGDRITSSVHSSEYHAYSEAVARFEAAELSTSESNQELRRILRISAKCGDYQRVRQYIGKRACHLRSLQIAEHDINASSGYRVKAPRRI